ncbi:hypothetical protein I6F16_12095 [Bradyrhizobium sp. IC4060]|nr:hypothetical protein [Bradyrhizobium sp. IC4060]MCA1484690.1 hypothetical protein [Bradyrhizobium sp. IC4061]
MLAGIIAHETGNGVVLSGNNPGGIMDPATGMARKMRFADLDAGISKTGQSWRRTTDEPVPISTRWVALMLHPAPRMIQVD